MALQYRSNEAVLTVCQNNRRQAIEISAVTPTAADLLGFSVIELQGKELRELLPPNLAETIGDYVEFETGGNDLGTVLGRVKDFKVVTKTGETLPLNLKSVRSTSPDQQDWFKLILRPLSREGAKEKLLALLQQNFKGHEVMDESLGLPDRHSLMRDVELVDHHVGIGSLQACFAVIELDHYIRLLERYSRAFCNRALKSMAELCRQNLREYDMVGALEGPDLGLLLMDITPESTRVVLNRLRWLLTSKLSSTLGVAEGEVTISVAFRSMKGDGQGKATVLECEHLLSSRDANSANLMLEATGVASAQARKA